MAKEQKAAESESEKEMQVLLAGATAMIAGKELQIKPYSWADTFRLAKPLGIVLHAFSTHVDDLQKALAVKKDASAADLAGSIGAFLMSLTDAENVVEALAVLASKASGIPRAEIDALLPDEFFRLATAIFEANRDFFLKKLAPMMQAPKQVAK